MGTKDTDVLLADLRECSRVAAEALRRRDEIVIELRGRRVSWSRLAAACGLSMGGVRKTLVRHGDVQVRRRRRPVAATS